MKKLITVGAVAVTLACSDGSGPTQPLSLSFATERPAVAATMAGSPGFERAASNDTLRDGTNTLVITKAEIVLREIELERQEVVDCDVEPEPAGCEDFEVGPVLIDLPLGPGTQQLVAIEVEPGTYVEVEFEIHKVSSGDAADAAFRQAHPTFVDKSIRVQGTFNGQPFTFESDLDVEQEMDLVPPLVIVDEATSTNLTIMVELGEWFRALDGTLLNPATGNKGGVNEGLIKENIKQSIEAFEDEDKDGDDRDEG